MFLIIATLFVLDNSNFIFTPILEAIKVLYNRSRVACIIQKFEAGVDCSLYPPLPSLEMTNFKLLKQKAEIEITSKYIAGFLPMLEKLSLNRIAKTTSELWRFLLFLSQDYSHYYSQVRTLCVSI